MEWPARLPLVGGGGVSITVTPDSSVEMGENHYGFCGRTSMLPKWS